jgi:hypothetical protein
MKRKRTKTLDDIQNEFNRIAEFLDARSLAKLRAASKSHGLAKAGRNEMDRRASDIATFFTPTVRAMEALIHEIAVMLKKTRFADPRVLHKAIATRARAHPDIAVTMDIREISRDRVLDIHVSL